MAEFERVARLDELPPGGRLPVVVDEVPALLIRLGETVYCIEDVCSHDGQPLTNGAIDAGAITCPRHGARFELATGKPLCMPATEPIRVFEVDVRGGEIWVKGDE